MWQAYYQKRNAALFRDLVVLTRETYRMTWWQASRMSYHLARAAATFGNARSDYEQVLPDLTAGYRIAHDWTGATYDPAVVARAELAWWVARRVPGQDSPEQVGALIAELNALLYGVPKEKCSRRPCFAHAPASYATRVEPMPTGSMWSACCGIRIGRCTRR
jgi:hypothetical protein